MAHREVSLISAVSIAIKLFKGASGTAHAGARHEIDFDHRLNRRQLISLNHAAELFDSFHSVGLGGIVRGGVGEAEEGVEGSCESARFSSFVSSMTASNPPATKVFSTSSLHR